MGLGKLHIAHISGSQLHIRETKICQLREVRKETWFFDAVQSLKPENN